MTCALLLRRANRFARHNQSHVNVLSAGGLVAMNGQRVNARFESGSRFGTQIELLIMLDKARKFGGQDAIEINLQVLVVMRLELKTAQVLGSKGKLSPEPNVVCVPNRVDDCSRRL